MDTGYLVFGDPTSAPRPASPPPIPYTPGMYARRKVKLGKPVPIPKVKKNPLPYGLFRHDIMAGRPYHLSWEMVGTPPMRHKNVTIVLEAWQGLNHEVAHYDIYNAKQEAILARQRMDTQRHLREQRERLDQQQRRLEMKAVLQHGAKERRLRAALAQKELWKTKYALAAAQRREAARAKLLKIKARKYWGYKPIKTYAKPIPLWRPPRPADPIVYDWYPKPYKIGADTGLDFLANIAAHYDDPRDARSDYF